VLIIRSAEMVYAKFASFGRTEMKTKTKGKK